MDYISVEKAAEKWGVTRRHIQLLCAREKVSGAMKISKVWVIPADAEKPPDGRRKSGKPSNSAKQAEEKHGKHK